MHEKLVELKSKLDHLYTTIEALTFPRENFVEFGTYTIPFLHCADLSRIPEMLSNKISYADKYEPSNDEILTIDGIIFSINQSQIIINHINHTSYEVAAPAINAYLVSMLYISNEINELFSFSILKNKDLLPKKIINRLDLYNSHLSSIEQKSGNIEEKINAINDAYDTAENLPTTVRILKEIDKEINDLKSNAVLNSNQTNEALEQIKLQYKEISDIQLKISKLNKEVDKEAATYLSALKLEAENYISKCEEAFRTSTSKGLAGAFEDKASKLNASIRYWVGGLVVALISGAIVGYNRLHALEIFLANPNSSGTKLFIQLLLSLLSVGAPLWFAWLATKQIGQRFRLAEDYEFKASVSKAYEGYRREAVQLDTEFSQRLFGNALTRLEEPPLRFVEESSHSSPMMEILSSENFKKMIERGGDSVDQALSKLGLSKQTKPIDPITQTALKESSVDE